MRHGDGDRPKRDEGPHSKVGLGVRWFNTALRHFTFVIQRRKKRSVFPNYWKRTATVDDSLKKTKNPVLNSVRLFQLDLEHRGDFVGFGRFGAGEIEHAVRMVPLTSLVTAEQGNVFNRQFRTAAIG